MPTEVNRRPNLCTSDEVNQLFLQLKAEIDQLRTELEVIRAQPPAQPSATFQMSPKMRERWAAVAAARDRLKAGETEATVREFLAEQYPDLGAEGLVKIARIQLGKRN